ncbi:hypothetical protein NDU88_004885, partial [Pleurodeles waltl]
SVASHSGYCSSTSPECGLALGLLQFYKSRVWPLTRVIAVIQVQTVASHAGYCSSTSPDCGLTLRLLQFYKS